MSNYEKAKVKLTKIQLSKSKSAAKNKTGATLRISQKILKMNNSLMNISNSNTKTKVINCFANSILTDMKFSKTQLYKIIQSGGFFLVKR